MEHMYEHRQDPGLTLFDWEKIFNLEYFKVEKANVRRGPKCKLKKRYIVLC